MRTILIMLCATTAQADWLSETTVARSKDVILIDVEGGKCSGFAVAKNLLVTANHCVAPIGHTRKFHIDGKPAYSFSLLANIPQPADVAVYHVQFHQESYAKMFAEKVHKLANGPPRVGDQVYAAGWAHGESMTVLKGPIYQGDQQSFNQAAFKVIPGMSGGPVFNMEHEVIGVVSSHTAYTNVQESQFCGHVQIKRCVDQAKKRLSKDKGWKPKLIVFSASWCTPCKRLHTDYDEGKLAGYDFEFYDIDTATGRAKMKEFQKATGSRVTSVPTVWVEGTRKFTTGYSGPQSLLGRIAEWVSGILKSILGIQNIRYERGPETLPSVPEAPLLSEDRIEEIVRERAKEILSAEDKDAAIEDAVALVKQELEAKAAENQKKNEAALAEAKRKADEASKEVAKSAGLIEKLRKAVEVAKEGGGFNWQAFAWSLGSSLAGAGALGFGAVSMIKRRIRDFEAAIDTFQEFLPENVQAIIDRVQSIASDGVTVTSTEDLR